MNAWLDVLARCVHLSRVQGAEAAAALASDRLANHEGRAFERMVRKATEECSRKGVGDLRLTELVAGYWNKQTPGSDIEIDLVALAEDDRVARFGSCKRSATRHT